MTGASEANLQAPPSISGSKALCFSMVNSIPPIVVCPGGRMRGIRLPRLPINKSGGSKKSHAIITSWTENSFLLKNVISATRKPPSRSQLCRLMESPSIKEAESSFDRATTTAGGDNVARADRSFGRENDPETSIIARTIGFARIDSSSAQALNYGDTSALPHGAQAFRVHNSGCMPAAADDPGCSV